MSSIVLPLRPGTWSPSQQTGKGQRTQKGRVTFLHVCCACCLQGPAGETDLDGTSGALPHGTSSWVCLRYHSPNQPKFHKSVHFFSVWFPARISIPSPNLNQDRCSTQIILPWYHLHLTCPAPWVDCPPLLQQITPSVTLVNSKLDCGVASCTVISPKFFLYFLGGFLLVIIQCHLRAFNFQHHILNFSFVL